MPKRDAVARWSALIQEHRSSGETVAAFCARHGVSTPTFYQWRHRLAEGAQPEPLAPFLPVCVTRAPERAATVADRAGVEIVLRGGRRLRLERGFDPAVLTAAIAALEGATC